MVLLLSLKTRILASDGLVYGFLGLCLPFLNSGFVLTHQGGTLAILTPSYKNKAQILQSDFEGSKLSFQLYCPTLLFMHPAP